MTAVWILLAIAGLATATVGFLYLRRLSQTLTTVEREIEGVSGDVRGVLQDPVGRLIGGIL